MQIKHGNLEAITEQKKTKSSRVLDVALWRIQRWTHQAMRPTGQEDPGQDQWQMLPKIPTQLARKQEGVTTSTLVRSVPEMGGWIAPPTSSSLRLVVEAFLANQGGVRASGLS